MKTFRLFARCAFLCITLAAAVPLTQAQENKEPPKKKDSERGTERTERKEAPAQRPPAQERQHTAPAPQVQQSPAPVNPPAQRQVPQQEQRRQDRPAQTTPPVNQAQPNNAPVNRTPPAPAAQPGRTFGNPPGGQPGRTFGNQPGRAAEPARVSPPLARPSGPPTRVYTTRGGDVIHRDAGGQVRQVRMANGTVVYHPPNAPRRIEVVRPGGALVVASAPGHGYVQRPVIINNTTIIKRTYIYNGVPQARIYRPRMYNGVSLVVYTPVRYYRPTFYAYAYNPWPRPIVFGWGWGGSPWYGYYGGYFTPYPVYASPSLWLTDYLIAATLENAYQERMAARAAAVNSYQDSGPSAPMSPEVKQAIADEVRRQIDQERAQQQGGQDPNIFADNGSHVFVAGSTIMVNSNMGECAISEGDVLQMNAPPPMNSAYADVIVLSSRGPDCRKGSRVSVGLGDLQEMHNQMLATIDRGMGDLQSKQGQGGLPPLPQGSAGTIDSPYASQAQPDQNVAGELTTVSQDADRAEQQAVSQSADAAAPPTLTLGLYVDDVKAIQGEPDKIVDLGSKKIYVYKDLKITFVDGKVSDIQ